MQTISLSDLVIPPGRQRSAFDEKKLADLRASIQSLGLFHAVLLRTDKRTLIAGERRTRAVAAIAEDLLPIRFNGEEVPLGSIPYVTIDDLNDIDLFQAEFDENVRGRANLTWQEEGAAIAKLHTLRSAQATADGSAQTKQATATEFFNLSSPAQGSQVTAVSNALLVAEHLSDPDVAKAKSLKEAANIVVKKMERAYAEQTRGEISAETSMAGHTVLCGSCVDLLPSLSDGAYDLAIIDPPYGVGAQSWNSQSGSEAGLTHHYEDDPAKTDPIVVEALRRSFPKMKPAAHIYMFCDIRRYEHWNTVLRQLGWDTWFRPLIWDKMGQGNLVGNCDGPRFTYEAILYARKGGKGVTIVAPDIIHCATVTSGKLHAAQKPVALYEELMVRSCHAGEKVIDFFCGSGPIFPAATNQRLYATGIELNPGDVATCQRRIREGDIPEDDDDATPELPNF